MKTLLRAAATEAGRIVRTPATLLLLVAVPVFYPLAISWLYAADSPVERPAVVVDQDRSAASRELALALDATPGVRVTRFDAPLEEARAALTDGAVELVVLVPDGYARHLLRGERATVRAWSDGANMLTYSVGVGALGDTVSALGRARGEDAWARTLPRARAAARAEPIQADVRVLGTPARAYGDFLVPAVFVIVLQQLVLLGMAFSASATREAGGAPPRGLRGWIGFAVPHAAVQALGIVALALTTRHFGWPLRDLEVWAALAAGYALALLPLGALLASLAQDRASTLAGLLFTSVPSLLLSGYVWPHDQMPAALALLGDALPSTPALEALRRVAYDDGGIAALAPALQHLAALSAIFMALLLVRIAFLHMRGRRAAAAPAV
ncbi:MAG: ABC transporter permease [Deltaproteobacteria bacterium HGW-Deltaproteobacteria-14]|jgi:ABC-2 type transport system permease protein|nr:MAG: ABC transporter permease [Deltaproteobacteria bacterium HGW-Deltaproteobacteria-14]